MFGLEHGCHLPEVEAVPLFFQQRREKDRDDPLRDVCEVEIIVSLHHSVHHPVHTEAPEREGETSLNILSNDFKVVKLIFGI